jgi:hypothetical protein
MNQPRGRTDPRGVSTGPDGRRAGTGSTPAGDHG